jgi:hypothetical protein
LAINIHKNLLICLISKQLDLPEPSVNVLGEELWPVASVKVAKTSGGPDELHVGGLHDALEVVVLVAGLEADQVHAAFAAVVAGVEPIPFGAGQGRVVASPRQPVVVVAVTFNSCETKMKLVYKLILNDYLNVIRKYFFLQAIVYKSIGNLTNFEVWFLLKTVIRYHNI